MQERPLPSGRPQDTRRDRVEKMLREAGERGVRLCQFHEVGIPMPNPHLESLRFEGWKIKRRWMPGRGTQAGEPIWVLAEERWFDAETRAVAA